MDGLNWKDIAMGGSALVQLSLVIILLIKFMPSWERVKLKETEVRIVEAKADEALAGALGQLASSIIVLGNSGLQMTEVIKDIAIEQRRATETIKILQRANSDASDELTSEVAILTDRIDRIEKRDKT